MKYIVGLIAIAMMFTSLGPSIAHAGHASSPGDLVKCPDYSAVYYIGQFGDRWSFPNENIYFSWYNDFSSVNTISCSELSDYRLAGNVMYQAGTRLVKMPSVDTVYYVEPFGNLRALKDEETAMALYGSDWNQKVDDISEAFFPAYRVGTDISSTSSLFLEPPEGPVMNLPDGYIGLSDSGQLFRANAEGDLVLLDGLLLGFSYHSLVAEAEPLSTSAAIYVQDTVEAHDRTEVNVAEVVRQTTPVWYTYTESRLATIDVYTQAIESYAGMMDYAADFFLDEENYEELRDGILNDIEELTSDDFDDYLDILEAERDNLNRYHEVLVEYGATLSDIEYYEEVNAVLQVAFDVLDLSSSSASSIDTIEEWEYLMEISEALYSDVGWAANEIERLGTMYM